MYSFGEEAVITGAISSVWRVATDIKQWPSWDPHEQKARFEGDFVPGAKGWSKPAGAPLGTFTITAVEAERMWASEAGTSLLYQPGIPDPTSFIRLNFAFPLGPDRENSRFTLSYSRALDLVKAF